MERIYLTEEGGAFSSHLSMEIKKGRNNKWYSANKETGTHS